jgi:hypothetical protein
MFAIFRKACYFDICSLMDHRSINQAMPGHVDDLAKKCPWRESVLRVLDRGLKTHKIRFVPPADIKSVFPFAYAVLSIIFVECFFSFFRFYFHFVLLWPSYCSFLTRDQLARASTTLTHRQSTCTQHTMPYASQRPASFSLNASGWRNALRTSHHEPSLLLACDPYRHNAGLHFQNSNPYAPSR